MRLDRIGMLDNLRKEIPSYSFEVDLWARLDIKPRSPELINPTKEALDDAAREI